MTEAPRQALKAGPLTADAVKLLTPGKSVLLWKTERATHLVTPAETSTHMAGWLAFRVLDGGERASTMSALLSYIGERGEDGWISAPEGGWSENPVPGHTVEVRYKDPITPSGSDDDTDVSDGFRWFHNGKRGDIIAFRLSAPPAAVEGGDQGSSAAPSVPTESSVSPRMLFWAFRYALGRQSYAVDEVATEIARCATLLTPIERQAIAREIRTARSDERIGMPCDDQSWAKVEAALAAQPSDTQVGIGAADEPKSLSAARTGGVA